MHPLMQAMNHPAQRALLEAALGMPPLAVAGSGPTRRAVLAAGAGTGLLIAVGALAPRDAVAASPGAEGAATGPLAPNQFVRVGTDNLVTIVCKHHEMGQGNTTGLASMAADELDADWALVRTEYAPSDPKLYANLAFGHAGHRRLLGDLQLLPADAQRRRDRARDAGRRGGRGLEGARQRGQGGEERAQPRLGQARDLRRDGCRRRQADPAREPGAEDAGAVHADGQERRDAARRLAVEVQRHGGLHHRRQAARAC